LRRHDACLGRPSRGPAMNLRTRSLLERAFGGAALLTTTLAFGCNGAVAPPAAPSTATTTPASTRSAPSAPAPVASGAAIVSVDIPKTMYAGQMLPFYVTVTNNTSQTWDDTFQLASVGGQAGDAARFIEDPLLGNKDPDRIHLPPGVTVPNGQNYTFAFVGKAPAAAGSFDVKFQILQDPSNYFGGVAQQTITVSAALAPGTVPPDAVDLSQATVHNSPPDVASWPATAAITRFDSQLQGFQLDFTKR